MHTLILALKCYAVAAPIVGLTAWALCHGGSMKIRKGEREIQRFAPKSQQGFTAFELLYSICWLFIFGITFGVLYAGYHFLAKFW